MRFYTTYTIHHHQWISLVLKHDRQQSKHHTHTQQYLYFCVPGWIHRPAHFSCPLIFWVKQGQELGTESFMSFTAFHLHSPLHFNPTAWRETIDGVLNLRPSVTSCFELLFAIKSWDMSTACDRTNAPDGTAEREDTEEHPDLSASNMLNNFPCTCKVRETETQKKGGLYIGHVSVWAFFASELKLQISISQVDIVAVDSVCVIHTSYIHTFPDTSSCFWQSSNTSTHQSDHNQSMRWHAGARLTAPTPPSLFPTRLTDCMLYSPVYLFFKQHQDRKSGSIMSRISSSDITNSFSNTFYTPPLMPSDDTF